LEVSRDRERCLTASVQYFILCCTGLWSRKSRHPTPTPGNFDYPTPTPTPTPGRLRPSAVLVT